MPSIRPILTFCALGLSGLMSQPAGAEVPPLRVGVTDPWVAEWVTTIGGEAVEVTLVSAGSGPQDLIYLTGLEAPAKTEPDWGGARTVVLSDGLPTLQQAEIYWQEMPPPHPNPEREPPCCRERAVEANLAWKSLIEQLPVQLAMPDPTATRSLDPHLWFDVSLAMSAALVIQETLEEHRPEASSEIEANAAAYLKELWTLNRWIGNQIRAIPPERRLVLSESNQLAYFGRAYGLICPWYTPDLDLDQVVVMTPVKPDPETPYTTRLRTLTESMVGRLVGK